jgi:hypothetical protein
MKYLTTKRSCWKVIWSDSYDSMFDFLKSNQAPLPPLTARNIWKHDGCWKVGLRIRKKFGFHGRQNKVMMIVYRRTWPVSMLLDASCHSCEYSSRMSLSNRRKGTTLNRLSNLASKLFLSSPSQIELHYPVQNIFFGFFAPLLLLTLNGVTILPLTL